MRLLPLLVALSLAGCATKAPAGVLRTRAAVAPAGIVATNGARLAGTVRLPAGLLIGNNGGGIVSDNGGGIVTNNGGRYKLAQAAGLTVALVDGAGQPVRGADGKPLMTTTDAAGAYAFAAAPDVRNLVVAIALGPRGTARALAPAGRSAGAPVDVDLASSLTTGFVLQAHVRAASDPQAALDKLPAAAEAATRAAAASALAARPALAPGDLTDAQVLAAIQALRAADAALDGQLEAVRRLYVTAGTVDQGAGRPAREVNLRKVDMLALAPNGDLLLSSDVHNRLWRLDVAARMQTFVGGGKAGDAPLTGQAPATAGLGDVLDFKRDAAGAIWLLEATRLSRLAPDGSLTEVWRGFADATCLVLRDEGAWVFLRGDKDQPPAVWAVDAAGAARELHAFGGTDQARGAAIARAALADDGTLLVAGHERVPGLPRSEEEPRWLARLSTDAWSFGLVAIEEPGDRGFALDPRGNVFFVRGTPTAALFVRRPDGSEARLGAVDADFGLDLNGALLLDDGSAWVASYGWEIFRAIGGQVAKIAGLTADEDGVARTEAFSNPTEVAVRADGTLLLGDDEMSAVFERRGGGPLTELIRTCFAEDNCPSDGPLTKVGVGLLDAMALDGTGALYMLDRDDAQALEPSRLRRLAPGGDALATLFAAPADMPLDGLAVSPAGRCFVTGADRGQWGLWALGPGAGKPQRLSSLPEPPEETWYDVAWAADDLLWLASPEALRRWTPARGAEVVAEDARIGGQGVLCDARGRVLVATKDGVLRYDPATKAFTAIAGPGSGALAGDTLDDSLAGPSALAFGPDGALHVADTGHRQFKVIPKERVAP